VLDIVDLVKETLEEACSNDTSDFFAGRLLVTARNLVTFFRCILLSYLYRFAKIFCNNIGPRATFLQNNAVIIFI
jgi:hypothetical protein